MRSDAAGDVVPHVQKGAALIVRDQKIANIVRAGFFSIAFSIVLAGPARAADSELLARTDSASRPTTLAAMPVGLPVASAPVTTSRTFVTFVKDGTDYTYSTNARTVRGLLVERGVRLDSSHDVSPSLDEAVVDGMRVYIRKTVPVTLSVDRHARIVHVAPQTIRALLVAQRIHVGAFDEVSPSPNSAIEPHELVRVTHVKMWTARVRSRVALRTQTHVDARLAKGRTRTIDRGRDGVKETLYRYTRKNGALSRTVLGTRVVRSARPRVIALGTATPSLARLAEAGFESAVHFAGSALHMIATAYTAGCSGCSGITATGSRAGFGIIAVDPRVIPLGTKLFIPGYGRAVAGDTGGAILGHRIDLGMNTQSAAIQFGRRPVTVYVLR